MARIDELKELVSPEKTTTVDGLTLKVRSRLYIYLTVTDSQYMVSAGGDGSTEVYCVSDATGGHVDYAGFRCGAYVSNTGTWIYANSDGSAGGSPTVGSWVSLAPIWSSDNTAQGSLTHSSQTITIVTNYNQIQTDGGSWASSGTPITFTVPAKSSYSVTFNGNGGSGSPSAQTKWYNESLTITSAKPTRSGYSFIKWNTKADGTGTDYAPGSTYTGNSALVLFAIWGAVVSYNANGGSGAPAQAVKTPGTPIAISTTQPTRTGYTFSKWNTSSDGTGTDYSPGASYSTDAPLVLYAQWTPNTYQLSFDANTGKHAPSAINRTYGQPVTLPSAAPVKMAADFMGWATNSSGTGTLYQPGGSYTSTVAAAEILYAVWRSTYTDPAFAIDVVRTDEHGSEEDDGDHVKISVLWSIHPLVEPDTGKSTNTATFVCYMSYVDDQEQTITTEVTLHDTQLYAEEETLSIAGVVTDPVVEPQDTKTSGEMQAIVPADTDIRYTIEVTVTDSRDTSVTKTEVLGTAFFTMDFLAGGHGVGVGKPATREMFDVGMQAQFDKPIMVAEKDVPPTFYYAIKPAAANLPVRPCVVIQTSDWSVWYCDDEETPAYHNLSDQNNLKKTDNYLAEPRLTDVDFYSWVTTVANVHTTGTANQLTQVRFLAESYANYNLPCADSHISVYSIDGSNTVYLRCVALDIRTNNVYVNCRKNNTWTGWSLLAPGTAITGISRSGTTFTATRANGGTFTFTQQDNNTTYSAGGGLTLSGTTFNLRDAGNNTGDTWVPVWSSGVLYHREIPAVLNSAYWRNTTSALWGSVTSGTTMYFYQRGNVCLFMCNDFQIRSNTTIGQVPSGYRPPNRVNVSSSIGYKNVDAGIHSDGSIIDWGSSLNTGHWWTATWPIA